MRKTFTYETMRHNVTPAQFLAHVRHNVDKRGGHWYRGDLDLGYFRNGNDFNFDIKHTDGPLAGIHEKSTSKPYEMQTYIKYPDGTLYNEICEFNFDDEKTGWGYYYLINIWDE